MKHIYLSTLFICISLTLVYHVSGQKKLVIIGSSTSACTGPSVIDSCYVNRLQKYYDTTQGPGAVLVTSLAVGGSTVYEGMPTGYVNPSDRPSPDAAHNITAALAMNPDAILVNYPSNGYTSFSIREIMFCLDTIKQVANRAGKPCYITSTQPRSEYDAPNRIKLRVLKDSIVAAFGPFAINFYDGLAVPASDSIADIYSAGDGIHLNNAAHGILAQRVEAKGIFSPALPISILNFTAVTHDKEVVINWRTASDQNISNYQVQRSQDGVHFTTIQQVSPTNSVSQNSYSVTDKSPSASNYYRLALVNRDSRPEYSIIIKVLSSAQAFMINKVYRAPSGLAAEIQSGEKQVIHLQLVSNSGQVLATVAATVNAGTNTVPVSLQSFSKGVYFIRVSNEKTGIQVRSFVNQ